MMIEAPFFRVIVHREDGNRELDGLCAGFEQKVWRKDQLISHLADYIPEFALPYSERQAIESKDIRRMLRNAARNLYQSVKYKNRGEIGELMLHVIIRELYNTVPAISKIYYKDGPNDTVKGFDAVHVIVKDQDLELWLGEVKFYTDITGAINDVSKEINDHIQKDYLRDEFIAITNKIDDAWPLADKLKVLLDANTSLDQVFSQACIPVLLTYDSIVIAKYDESSVAYQNEIKAEFENLYETFKKKVGDEVPLIVHLFLLPLKTKAELVMSFDEELRKLQQI